MKGKLIALITALLMLFPAGSVCDAEIRTLTLHGKSIEASSDAKTLDLGSVVLKNNDEDYAQLTAFLRGFPNLEKVDMYETKIRRNRLEALAEAFPDVEFGWTIIIPCTNPHHPEFKYHTVRTDATVFSTLHNNQCTTHSTEDLSVLRFCKSLQALDLGHNKLTSIDFIKDLTQIKVLIVALNPNLEDASPIGNLQDLEYLELFRTNVKDISFLRNCKNLLDLNITYNRIGDYSPLEELQKLERLWLYNSNNYSDNSPVPKETVDRLRTALPNCMINTSSGGTNGGWREHQRYEVINRMFNRSEYIPFDNQ